MQTKITSHFLMTEFDFWLGDVKSGASADFSEQAKESSYLARHFGNLYEYQMWREFNGFDKDTFGGEVGGVPEYQSIGVEELQ